jgi:tripartite-type tricarboxylate transporter receptor subunit TctC
MATMSRRSFNLALASLSGVGLLGAGTRSARAQSWPHRPVTIVMPFAAGGGTDAFARAVAAELSETIGGRFIVENRSGAGGNIGGAAVAKAEPDGYTLLFGTNGPSAINKLIYKDMQYDPERDLAPIGLVAEIPAMVTAGPQSPVKTFTELVAYAKANPGKVTFGSPGNGTLGHIIGVLVQQQTGIKLNHVPYRGSAPLTTDLMGGQVDLAMDFMVTYAQLVADGRAHGLTILSKARNDQLPNVPTIKEVGITGVDGSGWCAMFAPAGTPAPIIEKINTATNAFIKSEKGKAQLKTLSMTPGGGTPQELKDFVSAELARWRPVIKEANISI